MTSILLHEYVGQIDKLIDENRLVEAVEHCRHILHSYPRHIDTYRVMGKALLEKQDYDAASDLFLRILSADPNDFISHVGLSIVYKEERQNDQALWHLERAYEIQPYNVAIQSELRQLYAQEMDSRPGVIPLTRGALARLYMQGELYQQAISELRRILAEEPDRMDLQVLLAEAYWRDDQRIDAEEVCLNVLSELPNCIVINAILSEIWLQTGRIPEAQKYLQRLHSLTQQTQKSLDRETIAGKAFATEGAFPLPEEAPLEFLETGSRMPDAAAVPTADWVGEVDFEAAGEEDSLDGVVLEPESGMHSYDWLADIGEMEEAEAAGPERVDSETDWFSQDKAKNELNISTGELNAEWLADLRGDDEAEFQPLDLESAVEEDDDEAESRSVESDWFADEEEPAAEAVPVLDDISDAPATAEVEEEDLDWLDALADDESSLEIDATNLMDDSLLDWADKDEADSEPHVVKEPKTPFWLSEMADEEMEAVQLNPAEALDWIGEVSDEADVAEGTEIGEAEAEEAELPEEVEIDLDAAETAVAPSETLDTDSLGEADDWLAALTEGEIDSDFAGEAEEEIEAGEPVETVELEATVDELAALSDAEDWMESAAVDLETVLEPDEVEDDFPNLAIPELEGNEITEIPDWLDNENPDLSEESEAAVSSENDPQEMPQAEKPQDKDEPGKVQDEEETGSDAFDWLDDLSPERAEALPDPPIETEGMPSWMANIKDDGAVEVVDEWDSQSADIPQWLQEPVDISDLDEDDSLLEEAGQDEAPGLTGLLAEMETTEEALPLDNLNDMDALFSDWVDEDAEGSLADLVGDLEGGGRQLTPDDFIDADGGAETAVPEPTDEPEEVGLTGLLANLNIEIDELESEATEPDDDFLGELLANVDEEDIGDFLFEEDDALEPETEYDDALGLGELDLENVSLTQLLSEAGTPEEPAEMASLADDDGDDWLSDLTDLTEIEEEPESEPAEEAGLTGMLANLLPDEDGDVDDAFQDLEDQAEDEMGLTDLLAGIDYAEDAIDSEINIALPEFDFEPDEPPLTEVLADMEAEEDLPVSAEDTTWLMQLEEDTGGLPEPVDDFDMAEETGLDWLTTPAEPEDEEPMPEPDEETVEEDAEEEDGTVEDWDDAMSWLEELAAQQEEPVGELPSVAETMLEEELDTPADLIADSEDSDLDWLSDITGSEEDAVATEADEDSQLELFEADAVEEEDDEFGLDDLLADEEVSWLDELATDRLAGSEVEELETVADLAEVSEEPDILEDSWLDELALEDEEPEFADLPETMGEAVDLELDVSEGDLDWLDAVVDEVEEEELEEEMDTAVPDEEEQEPLSEADYKVIGVTDALKESSGIEEAEADLEEALAWLDELDEGGGTEQTDEAPPTLITPTSQDLAWDDEPETVLVTPEPDELTLALDRLEQRVKDEGVAVPETAASSLRLSTDELNAALDWIEQAETTPAAEAASEEAEAEPAVEDETESIPVAEAEEMIAETAVVEEIDTDAEVDLVGMADDPEAWLEQLLSDEADMAIEMEPPPIKPSEDAVFVTDDALETTADEDEAEGTEEEEVVDSLLDDVTLDEVPDDPDAVVAWLAQQVSGDDLLDIEMEPPPIKPSEDAVYVTDDAAAEVEEADQMESPEAEADGALDLGDMENDPEAWLEQLLSDDMLDVDMEPPPIKPSEDAVYVTDDAALVTEPELEIEPEELEVPDELVTAVSDAAEVDDEVEADVVLDLGDMEDDPEAWLEQLLSDDLDMDVEMEPPPIKPSEDAMFVTDDARAAAEVPEETTAESEAPDVTEVASEVSEADIIADVPDDEDEAMAWLEQLAAQQGAALEELPTITDSEAEPQMPDWMAEDLEELAVEPDLELAEPAKEADEETAVPLDTAEITAKDEDIDAELPEWLDTDEEEQRGRIIGQTDWLRALPEVDVDTWLSAEEEATLSSPTDEIILPDTGPLTSGLQTSSAEEEIDEDVLFEPVIEPSSGAYSVDAAKLNLAQESLASGRINDAITQFKELVAEGTGMMSIIAELEQATQANPQAPALAQVLGDAYMRNGQLQKALAAYRTALDQM